MRSRLTSYNEGVISIYDSFSFTTVAFDSKTFLKNVGQAPGIYQMFDEEQALLYVGKAKIFVPPVYQLKPKP